MESTANLEPTGKARALKAGVSEDCLRLLCGETCTLIEIVYERGAEIRYLETMPAYEVFHSWTSKRKIRVFYL